MLRTEYSCTADNRKNVVHVNFFPSGESELGTFTILSWFNFINILTNEHWAGVICV